ncbi:MAG: glycosyltransferase, partial [Actinobacteria bacterium]|nr:glycosyltransferase [Actinomycetota bacterium]
MADPSEWTLGMSVVLPAYGREERLEAVLVALSRQTYPSHLTEVIVVDDGSEPPLDPELRDGTRARVLRQERDGFGLARARNTGAADATGEVVVFLDSDMIPAETWLEAHARPHHHARALLAVGPRTHVQQIRLSPEEVRSAESMERLFAESGGETPAWLLERWARTDDARLGDDVWWGTSGGNLSVRSDIFRAVGGFDDAGFREWGGEDNDLGYRLYQAGVYVVPVHAATAWHLGPATNESDDIEERRRRVKIRLASRVASESLPRVKGVSFKAPDIAVELGEEVMAIEELTRRVGEILSDTAAVSTRVSINFSEDTERGLLRDYFSSEARLVLGPPDTRMAISPISVTCNADSWPQGLAAWLVTVIGEGRSALIAIEGRAGRLTAWSTRVRSQVQLGLLSEKQAMESYGGVTMDWEQARQHILDHASSEARYWMGRAAAAEDLLTSLSNRR